MVQILSHLDAYRLENALEAEDLDIEAMLAGGPLLVEWADRIHGWRFRKIVSEIQLTWLADELRQIVITYKGKTLSENCSIISRKGW